MSDKPSISQQAQGSYIAQAAAGGTATVQVVLLPPAVQEQNRVRFLKRLRVLYEDLWEQSLQGAALMTLGLTEKPEVVLRHTELLLRAPQQPERPLPEGTTHLEVYDEAGQELLVLGEPGAGKSTLLLELARQLVVRAEQDPGHPFPVILPLSSWAVKQAALSEWLAAQVSLIYDVPRQLSRTWVQTNQILSLLDGLDEVPQEARVACIEAINTYRKEHLVPLVVCSRRAEYEEIAPPERLVVHSAVVIEPLTRQQVETYLDQAGPALAAVRTVLHANPVLQELTTTPLMLSVLTLAYAGMAVQDLPQHGSADEQQQQVFAAYVKRMEDRKGDALHYPLERIQDWLGWLAGQMRAHSQTVFYLEHLQPDWLAPVQRHAYTWLAILSPAVLIGVFASLFLFITPFFVQVAFLFQNGVLGGLLGWLLSGPSPEKGTLPPQEEGHRRQGSIQLVSRRIAISAIIGLIAGFSIGLDSSNRYGPGGLRDGCIHGVMIGLSSLLLSLLLPSLSSQHTLSLEDNTAWQGKYLDRLIQTVHGQRTLLVIAIMGLAGGLSYGLRSGLNNGLFDGLTDGFSRLSIGLS